MNIKKFFVNASTVLFLLTGTANLGRATFNEFNPDALPAQKASVSHDAREGEIEVGLSALISLLNEYMSNKKGNQEDSVDHEIDLTVPFTIEYSLGNASNGFSRNTQLFKKIVVNELDFYFRSTYEFRYLEFEVKDRRLYLSGKGGMPPINDHTSMRQYKKHIESIIQQLLEEKVRHIGEVYAEEVRKITVEKLQEMRDNPMKQLEEAKSLYSIEEAIQKAFEDEMKIVEKGDKNLSNSIPYRNV